MNMEKNICAKPIIDGRIVAQYFKYYSQYNNSHIVYPQQLNRIAYITVYNKNKKIFDIAAELFRNNKVDIIDYIKWFVLVQHYAIKDLKYKLLNQQTIDNYIEYLKIKKHLKKIFRYFNKNAYDIADQCIKLNLFHCVDYIKKLINDKKLAQYYLTGKISKYFLAGIPKFSQIVEKLDQLSKDEFHQICSMYDTYHREIADAMQQELGKIYGPFSYVDNIIYEKNKSIV